MPNKGQVEAVRIQEVHSLHQAGRLQRNHGLLLGQGLRVRVWVWVRMRVLLLLHVRRQLRVKWLVVLVVV